MTCNDFVIQPNAVFFSEYRQGGKKLLTFQKFFTKQLINQGLVRGSRDVVNCF